MDTLDKVLNQDYSDCNHKRLQNVNGFAIARIHMNDAVYRYMIEKDGRFAIYDASQVEFFDVQIPHISESTLVLSRENPREEGNIQKEIPLEKWRFAEAKDFVITVKDTSYWNVNYEPNTAFYESNQSFASLPGAYKTNECSVFARCWRNFRRLGAIQYDFTRSGEPNDMNESEMLSILKYYEEKHMLYYPKRDTILIYGLYKEKEKKFKKLFNRNIPVL